MNPLTLTRPLSLLALCLTVSGCLYNNGSTSASSVDQPKAPLTAQQAAAVNANGTTTPPEEVRTASGGSLGGYLEQFMDANDRSRMARALDGSLGKSTSWKNPVSGATFAVTPIRKISNGDSICRAYSVTMNKTGVNDRVGGTACIGDDGLWHVTG